MINKLKRSGIAIALIMGLFFLQFSPNTVNVVPQLLAANVNTAADMVQIGDQALTAQNANFIPATTAGSYYVLENDLRISNTSQETVRNLKLEVPLMADLNSPYQVIIGEEFSIQPTQINEAANGNRTGVFAFSDMAPGTATVLVQKYTVKENGSNWLQLSDTTSLKNPEAYLAAATKIESSAPEIVAVANNITSQVGRENELAIAQTAFAFTRSTLTYNLAAPSANKGALAGLEAGSGICEEFASLFVATSRAAGVPARIVNGFANDVTVLAQDNNTTNLQGRRHQWAEFYLDGKGWIPVDPTLASTVNPMFGALPAGHYIAQNYGDSAVTGTYSGGKVAISFDDTVTRSN